MLEENLSRSANAEGQSASLGAAAHERSQLSRAGRLIRSVLQRLGDPAIQITLWNGDRICTSPRPPIATISIADRVTLFKLAINPDLDFGEAYSSGKLTVDGDLTALIAEIYRGKSRASDDRSAFRILSHTLQRTRSNTLSGSRDNIHHH